MVLLTVILFSAKFFLFVDIYIDDLKLKAYKLFENSDADLSWLLFLKKPTLILFLAVVSPDLCFMSPTLSPVKDAAAQFVNPLPDDKF